MKQVVLNSGQENGTFSMANQMQTMMQEKKLFTIQKFWFWCDYNNARILVRGNISIKEHQET